MYQYPTSEAIAKAIAGSPLLKSWTTQTGLVNYDLQRPAKLLYPLNTPVRQLVRRTMGNGDVATRYKTITALNVNNMSPAVGEGQRGGVITDVVNDALATYKTLGLEDNVTMQADWASKGFENVIARAVTGLLQSCWLSEENVLIGGNSSLALGTTPTPTLTAGTAGSLATATYSVICVALTNDGYIASRGSVVGTAPIVAQVTRTNADNSTLTYGGYSARKSANATVAVSGPTGSVAATVPVVPGAVAYAWFWGAAGSEILGAITTINSVVITAAATGTQTAASLPAADYSQNAYLFDGLISQASNSANNAAYYALGTGTAGSGSTLTPDNEGGIVEIDRLLFNMWNSIQSIPDIIWCNAQEMKTLKKALVSTGSAPMIRYNIDAGATSLNDTSFAIGSVVGWYTAPYTMEGGKQLRIRIHPKVPPGTMIFQTVQLPYQVSNERNPLEMHLRRDYFEQRWPLRTMMYEFGVYFDGVLVNYFPPSLGIITNIAPG